MGTPYASEKRNTNRNQITPELERSMRGVEIDCTGWAADCDTNTAQTTTAHLI
jgi:hypothetical protein